MTVKQLLAQTTSAELTAWQQFYRVQNAKIESQSKQKVHRY